MSLEKNDKLVWVDINKLKPHPKNTNHHPKEQIERLAKIINYQGFRSPIVVSNLSGFIVAGHGRLEAAKKLGLTKVPVSYQDFEDAKMELAHLNADNAIALWAEIDMKAMTESLKEVNFDLDLDFLGFKDFKLDDETKSESGDEDNIPETTENEFGVKLGDIYQLGEHRIMCGDSTDAETVAKLMDGKKADMVFTDPPYNQETEGGFKSEIGTALRKQSREIEHMCDFNPGKFLEILPSVFEKSKMNAYVFCNKDLVVDYLKWSREKKFSYNILFWKKPSAIPIGGSYRPDVEYLLVFRRSGIFNGGLNDVSYSKSLEFNREVNKVHPTMKPVEMIENQLKIASNNKSIVSDLFLGSGSTLIACEKTNRVCYGMELDPHYVSVIIKRWQDFTGKQAVKL